jgi:hypothetical protein
MKTVLMIAYDFPPEGHAGVYRPLRFVRHLSSVGWNPIVISAGGPPSGRHDPELLGQLPPGTTVLRPVRPDDWWQSFQKWRGKRSQQRTASVSSGTSAANGSNHGRFRAAARELVLRAESWLYHPDTAMHWIAPATQVGVELCSRSRPTVIWVTGPPWSSFLVADRISRQTGVPYVLDFRTSWTIVPSAFEAIRPSWAQMNDRRVLRALFTRAQAVTFFYAAEAECFWRMYAGSLDVSRIHIIPNGFDGEIRPFVPPTADKLTILYTGTLSDYRYDTFLKALAAFIRQTPSRSTQLAVHFVGEDEPSLGERVRELHLSDVVSVRPPMRHSEIETLQREAHALLMLERKPTHKGYELLAGAKLFNYLKAGIPILGVVPEGEASRILRDVGVSTVADAASADAIGAVLDTLFRAWIDGRLASFVPDRVACERYSAKQQTAALARALDGLPSLHPFVPGAADIAPSLRADFAAAGLA